MQLYPLQCGFDTSVSECSETRLVSGLGLFLFEFMFIIGDRMLRGQLGGTGISPTATSAWDSALSSQKRSCIGMNGGWGGGLGHCALHKKYLHANMLWNFFWLTFLPLFLLPRQPSSLFFASVSLLSCFYLCLCPVTVKKLLQLLQKIFGDLWQLSSKTQ